MGTFIAWTQGVQVTLRGLNPRADLISEAHR
jgi:hypothetical protein